jgi:hypothetical protein
MPQHGRDDTLQLLNFREFFKAEVQLPRILIPGTSVNSPSSDASGVVGWHHSSKE